MPTLGESGWTRRPPPAAGLCSAEQRTVHYMCTPTHAHVCRGAHHMLTYQVHGRTQPHARATHFGSHVHIHICTRVCAHACMCAQCSSCVCACLVVHAVHVCTHTCQHGHRHVRAHSGTHTDMHASACTPTRVHMHAHAPGLPPAPGGWGQWAETHARPVFVQHCGPQDTRLPQVDTQPAGPSSSPAAL